ncbi:MAG: hypothetical protein IT159_12590 [Bryobacterales bacterium]|jgi:hypothetical protein|nr:hypothetical protein [Bryobacterales bacterium]
MAENGRMRWASEQAFFDSKEYSGGPLPSETVDRYMNCRHPFTPAEHPFRALGDIRGKHILEPARGAPGFTASRRPPSSIHRLPKPVLTAPGDGSTSSAASLSSITCCPFSTPFWRLYLEILRRRLPGMRLRMFGFLGRIWGAWSPAVMKTTRRSAARCAICSAALTGACCRFPG